MEVKWNEFLLTLQQARYQNGRIAILLMSSQVTRYGTLSTNMPDIPLAPDEFVVPVWNHSEDLLNAILATGAVQDTGIRVFGQAWSETIPGTEAPIWRVRAIDADL